MTTERFETAVLDLTAALRSVVDYAVRAATWVLLEDDDTDDEGES